MASVGPKRVGRNEIVEVDAVSSEEIVVEHAEAAAYVWTALGRLAEGCSEGLGARDHLVGWRRRRLLRDSISETTLTVVCSAYTDLAVAREVGRSFGAVDLVVWGLLAC